MELGTMYAKLELDTTDLDVALAKVESLRQSRKRYALAFLLGIFTTLAVERWVALEQAASRDNLRLSYIEGFLERATRQ